jgi:hypothetical protein
MQVRIRVEVLNYGDRICAPFARQLAPIAPEKFAVDAAEKCLERRAKAIVGGLGVKVQRNEELIVSLDCPVYGSGSWRA